jgi:DNA-directed RNA polymerase subunit M/transcription elongation factor TFIIS
MYTIIVCHSCGQLLLAKDNQKTRHCPHCETRINTNGAKVVATARTAQEASKLIRTLKLKPEKERDTV